MSIREKLHENPSIGIGAGALLVLLAMFSIAYQAHDDHPRAPDKYFFTTDDGKTWFPDSVDNIPPYTHDGKTAVRAFVFDIAGQRSVHYLWRYTDPARQRILSAQQSKSAAALSGAMQYASMTGLEVKRPGDTRWTNIRNHSATDPMMRVLGPNNSPAIVIDP